MAANVPEQPADWTEPGAYLVAPGVHRLPVPLPLDGLRAVNVYALTGPDGLTLVDSGWAMPDTARALTAALRRLGHDLGDVAHVLVTHAHGDHYMQALALRDLFGTRVSLGRGEFANVERVYDEGFEGYDDQVALLRLHGAPELAERMAKWATEHLGDDFTWGRPDDWLDDGTRVTISGRALDVIATPGHTRGHVVLRDKAGLLFAGDHVLPHITPSIGFEPAAAPAPLRSYLASLRLVRDLPDTLLLPAHGPVTGSVHTRVDELLKHHEQRLDAVLVAVRNGRSTAPEVARELRWTRRERHLDELDLFNTVLAVLETAAHLDVLVLDGTLTATEADGVRRYVQLKPEA